MEPIEIRNAIRSFFENTNDYSPQDEENLFECGVLDSYGVVEFLDFIQEKFKVEIDLEEITEENFSTITTVTRMVKTLMET